MNVSQKCQYALRAVFELAKYWGGGLGPISVSEIAKTQAIPPRFLELILGQLRQGGFVESRRGVHGGYLLPMDPARLYVGQIIRFIDGPVAPVRCVAGNKENDCPLRGNCAFMSMWSRARDAVAGVYDQTSFQNLIEEEAAAAERYVASYCI
ncbi:MAG: Rrf2 family transcriptional regulator [Phycisphaerae bacterium]|nr:Rrf2 family transcriptional regulator [Phycisphaerae bacterium]